MMYPDQRLFGGIEQKLAVDSAIVDSSVVPIRGHPGGPRATGAGEHRSTQAAATMAGLTAARWGVSSSADSSLVQLAQLTLAQNALIPKGKVRGVVRNAWLILEGEVEARFQKQAAEDAVKGLPGIRGVSNNILIESEVMAQRVSRKIDEAFVRNARLTASRISVTASNHKIILCGSVHSGAERDEAEAAAWSVEGVADVVNRIRATGSKG